MEINFYNKTNYVDRNILVKEIKAPTDESLKSLKLLKDYQEKAIESIVYSGTLSNNLLNDVQFNLVRMYETYGYRLYYSFKINNKVVNNKIDLDYRDEFKEDLIKMIIEEISKDLIVYMGDSLVKEIINKI